MELTKDRKPIKMFPVKASKMFPVNASKKQQLLRSPKARYCCRVQQIISFSIHDVSSSAKKLLRLIVKMLIFITLTKMFAEISTKKKDIFPLFHNSIEGNKVIKVYSYEIIICIFFLFP